MSNPQGGYPGSGPQYPYDQSQAQGQGYPQAGYGGAPNQPPPGQPPYPPYQQYGMQQQGPPPGQHDAAQQGHPPHQQAAPPFQGYPPQQYPPQQQPPGQYPTPPAQGQGFQNAPPQGQGYPPQQQPPGQQMGYPAQGQDFQNAPPGQQMGYPAQGQGFQNAPPPGQGYPPQQQAPGQQMGYPPQGQGFQQPPPHAQGYPPQQYPPGYPPQQQPPQGQYMGTLPQGQHHPQHPQGHQPFGGHPQNQVQPAAPSPGYVPDQKASGDAKKEAEALRKAMKGFGTDEARLIDVLVKPDPLRMALITHTYTEHIGRDIEADVKSETSGDLETGLVSLLSGPLGMDVRHLKKALSGMGTNEDALDDILLCRSNADMKAIKAAYARTYKKSLEADIKSDLSGKTEDLFLMVLNANRDEPGTFFDHQAVDTDVREIHRATKAQSGTDEITVCSIFVGATDAKICAISDHYKKQYHTSIGDMIKDEFSGHMKNALLYMLESARNPAKAIASRLDTIFSSPVDDNRLIYWLIKLHWNPTLFETVKVTPPLGGGSTLKNRVLIATSTGSHTQNLMKRLLG